MHEQEVDKLHPPMHTREITLEDGRYMIFFTFGDETTDDAVKEGDV